MSHDAITIALKKIYHTIPQEILHATFEPNVNNMTLDTLIHEKVIVDRVLNDTNIYGGKTKKIMLLPSWHEETEVLNMFPFSGPSHTGVFRIPPEARENKSIVCAIDVKPPQAMTGYFGTSGYPNNNCGSGAASALACNALQTVTGANSGYTPTVELLSGDMIRLYPSQVVNLNWVLNCRLAFDEYFTNIEPTSLRTLSDLIECAVKTYIYNSLIIKIDRGFIHGGFEIGMFKNIVESYSDQAEKYNELLLKFQGTVYKDPQRAVNFLKYFVK